MIIQMRMSEQVARYIMEMLDSRDGTAEIRRNELADQMGCVPSQINYVIKSSAHRHLGADARRQLHRRGA